MARERGWRDQAELAGDAADQEQALKWLKRFVAAAEVRKFLLACPAKNDRNIELRFSR